MNSNDIRKRFLDFFAARGHTIVSSSSLIPDDPTVLLTTAGMQQFKPYYTGAADPIKDFGSKNTASVQKSFRTSDIDEVGDESHLTFFEMLGNFSFGGYFKKEAITYAHEFITKEINTPISYVTVFEGSHSVPKDEESRVIWNELGVTDVREEGIEDVFWGPTGSSGPCGPTTEIYCKNAAGQDIEVWNIVFNQFVYPGSREDLLTQTPGKTLEPLTTPGVDTGMGLERLAMISQNVSTIFETDLFQPILNIFAPTVGKERVKYISADHVRAVSFLIADGIRPANKGAGYILRRLLRRLIMYNLSGLQDAFAVIVKNYNAAYPELAVDIILSVFNEETKKFGKALMAGQKEMNTYDLIDAKIAFHLYESYGLPYEVIKEIGPEKTEQLTHEAFDQEFKKHQEISRAGVAKKFGGHGLLLDTGELKAANEQELNTVTRLHTATHLLQAALRKVLGDEVRQMGSDITAERTRFDFSFPRKVTREEITQVEQLVNNAIQHNLTMEAKKMPYDEAVKTGALYFVKDKYPDEVNVYSAYDAQTGKVFSREFCGGPHVGRTGEIGVFKIIKEESSSAGVRRIRATIE